MRTIKLTLLSMALIFLSVVVIPNNAMSDGPYALFVCIWPKK